VKKLNLIALLVLAGNIFATVPAMAQTTTITATQLLPTNVGDNLGLPTGDVRVTIARIVRVAMGLLGIVVVMIVLYGGFLWMTAGGNDEQVGTAKKFIVSGVIGLAIVLSAYAIATFVIGSLVNATTAPAGSVFVP
jgi:phage shock protein PspC (stress-responsive transcriptional regulator)